ncbi:MAG: tRNA 2-selenouridine(34) synthase MnmH [Sediminibacterium sp.]|nr:tRNA 2-selenouridine(34) synthase MnmH [Sediminibacterium sp.]
MAVHKINIDDFIIETSTSVSASLRSSIIIDVRSPAEFEHAHIPSALNIPLFDNEQRAMIGTTYKKQSREAAIKAGLPLFGNKMLPMIESVEAWIKDRQKENDVSKPTIYVHCWRGGMRSAAVAWLLDLYGYKVIQLTGGYKAYRNWVLAQFSIPYSLKVVGGYTGSGKTEILHALQEKNYAVIDLEGIAHHKGSAYGAIGQLPQPSQEMFENLLAEKLLEVNKKQKSIWIEDESQRIGTVLIPTPLFHLMRNSTCYFMTIPFEQRLNFIVEGYGSFDQKSLIEATMRIQKRLGGLETKTAVDFITAGALKEAFSILLKYYDKWYEKNTKKEVLPTIELIPVSSEIVDPIHNAQLLEKLSE